MTTVKTRNQRPVSRGLARQIGNMVKSATQKYNGGITMAELAKGDPGFLDGFYKLLDDASLRALVRRVESMRVWQQLSISGGKSAEELIRMMMDLGTFPSGEVQDVMRREGLVSHERSLSMVLLRSNDLGFTGETTRKEFFERAFQTGLEICPVDAVPHLRAQYQDQPKREIVRVATNLVVVEDGGESMFWLVCTTGGTLSLTMCPTFPDVSVGKDDLWAFVRSRK